MHVYGSDHRREIRVAFLALVRLGLVAVVVGEEVACAVDRRVEEHHREAGTDSSLQRFPYIPGREQNHTSVSISLIYRLLDCNGHVML